MCDVVSLLLLSIMCVSARCGFKKLWQIVCVEWVRIYFVKHVSRRRCAECVSAYTRVRARVRFWTRHISHSRWRDANRKVNIFACYLRLVDEIFGDSTWRMVHEFWIFFIEGRMVGILNSDFHFYFYFCLFFMRFCWVSSRLNVIGLLFLWGRAFLLILIRFSIFWIKISNFFKNWMNW